MARLLVPADYGLVAMAAPFVGLVQMIADLGLAQSTIQREHVKSDEISGLFWFGLLLNAAMTMVVVALSPLFAWILNEPRLMPICMVLAALLPISGLSAQPTAVLTRNLQFGVLALVDVASPTLGLLAGFSTAWLGFGYWSLLVALGCEGIVSVVLVWALSGWRPSRYPRSGSHWHLVRVGGHLTAFNLAQYLTTTLDNLIIAFTQGAVALGLYDKAYKMVTQPVGQLMTPANRVAVPVLVRSLSDAARYRRVFVSMVQMILLFAAPGIVTVLLLSKQITLALLGPNWDGISPIVSWFCLGSLASPIYSCSSWLFTSQGRASQQLRYGIVTSLISLACFTAGIPWGPTGVAAGGALCFLLITVPLTCWAATRTGPVSLSDILVGIAPIVLSLTGASLSLIALIRLVPIGGMGLAGALLLAYGSFFGILLLARSGRRIVYGFWTLRADLLVREETRVA